ncbi:MAG: ABC transporter substrate-binding protein [Eubacteriales bacterium]|nr:ABC transporter substrate-binding protein [Eubacteriales bacterium]
MKRKAVATVLCGTLALSMAMAAPAFVNAEGTTTITLYTTVPGHDADFEAFCAEFMEANPDITVNYIAYDSSEKQKWMTLYASGEAPTVSLMDAIDIQENIANMAAYDLEGADAWIAEQVGESNLEIFQGEDGALYGVPNSVQAMGILYNKATIEAATGEEFDPSTIKSNADLEALCEKIQAGGVAPIMFTGVDWSLGSHFLSQVFSGAQGEVEDQIAFIEGIKDGSIDLKTNDVWNGVMDTFDIIAKYNYNSKDPLVGNTELDGQAMAAGNVAMWFMGDWGWSYLQDTANIDDGYGIMPCPLNGDSEDPINQQLLTFPAKGYCIDGSQADEAQQEAGKKLVEFLTIEKAQEMSDALSMALPFSGVDITVESPTANATLSYIADGATASTYAFSSLLPSDFWSENGAVMQQYLVGMMDRDAAADAIQAYWQAQ